MLVFSSRRLGRDPFAELRKFTSDFDRLFASADRGGETAVFPPVNLWSGDEGVAVTAEIPGVEPSEIDLSVEGDVLRIAGERKTPDVAAAAWRRRERGFGKFARTIRLPYRVDPNSVEARFRNGLLEILLRRPEEDRPRKIDVKAS